MKRVYNFAAGPSTLPIEVLKELADEMLDYQNSGTSVMEMSHRSKDYLAIFNETKELLKHVFNIPDNYEILFLQGGASLQFSMIPMNLLKHSADYIITGNFSKKAYQEALKVGKANCIYDGKDDNYQTIPSIDKLTFNEDIDYVHLCSNNTIYGTQWKIFPKPNVPLVCDMSSDILSREIDINQFGLIYAGAQKNMGIAGLTVVIIRKDLINTNPELSNMLDYGIQAKNDSMYNTPATYAIYVLGKVLKWINQKGLKEVEKNNIIKANLLYDYLDQSKLFIPHSNKANRSLMNVTFRTNDEQLDSKFIELAKDHNLINLKGHRLVGGIRASIYNAMEISGIEELIKVMKEFEGDNL